MRQLKLIFALSCYCILNAYNLQSQNPNWVMPGWNFIPGPGDYDPLPQNPAWPDPSNPGSNLLRYTGASAQFTQAGYTGPDGELMCFVVDDKVYDKEGWQSIYKA